jgi:elongation factor G
VVIRIEPLLAETAITQENEFENAIIGGTVPKEYIPAIENGVMEGLSSGSLAGYPVVGVKVTLLDGSFHTVDSSELAFEQAAIIALRDLLPKAKPVLLEPVMRVQVIVPEQYFGAVQGNLVSKRGEITNSHVHGGVRVIDAKVPLGEMFGYSSQIRSATAGRGTFTMEPLNYERVPEQVSEKILMGSY